MEPSSILLHDIAAWFQCTTLQAIYFFLFNQEGYIICENTEQKTKELKHGKPNYYKFL